MRKQSRVVLRWGTIASVDVEAQACVGSIGSKVEAFLSNGSLDVRNLSFEQIDALGRRTKGQDVATCA